MCYKAHVDIDLWDYLKMINFINTIFLLIHSFSLSLKVFLITFK